MGLAGALSTNLLNMVGVGPFLTIPIALAAMDGPQAMLGWILGAVLALCDGLVWAELGSRFPDSGGPYFYLLNAFGPRGLGRMLAFLFLWQSLLIGPISIASGAVGFAQYATVFHPFTALQMKIIAMVLCLINLGLLYRSIQSISILSIVVTVAVLGTCLWIVFAGATHFNASQAFSFPAGAFRLTRGFWIGLGSATLIATYDYGGYGNACFLGGEVKNPRRTLPRAVLLSIVLTAVLYLAMNISIIALVPWRAAEHSKAVVADFMRLAYGSWAARAVSLLILVASWGSAFSILLGFSRVPYAAAEAGQFPAIFAKVHPTKHFPTVSLLYMGLLSTALCFVSLESLIAALMVVQTIVQFIAQCIAVMLLRHNDISPQPGLFRMPLYPLPALIALLGWVYIVTTSELRYIALGFILAIAGAAIYLVQASRQGEWPFRHA